MGKVATSRVPSRGSPPLQSEGGNQKWPTSGQSGYVNPAVSGIRTAAELRGGGGGIRSGPFVGNVAMSPLPSRGSPPLQSGGGGGRIRSGPRVGKMAMSPLPSQGCPPLQSGGGGIRSGPQVDKVATSPLPSRGSPPLQSGGAGGRIRSGPQVGKMATSPLPSRGSPPLQSGGGGGKQKWPTCGRNGYVTPAVPGIPTAAELGGGGIRSGPLVGKVAMSPLPSRGSPPLQSGGGNQKWPTCGQSGYVTPAVSGIPPLQSGGGNQKGPTCGQSGYVTPAVSGIPTAAERGGGGDQKWPTSGQSGYVTPAASGIPSASKRGSGGQNQKWPTSGQNGYVTLAVSGIPTAAERGGGGDQKWPTCRQNGYVTPSISGIPTAAELGGGDRKWPTCGQSGYVTPAVSGIPTAAERGGGGNRKSPTCGQNGYVTPAVSGMPTAAELGGESEVAHKWAKWLRHPCRLGDPQRFKAGGKIRSGPQVGKMATSPLPSRGSPPLQSGGGGGSEVAHLSAKWLRRPFHLGDPHRCRVGGGGNQKWPTCGQSGYVTPAVSGIPTAAERGGGNRKSPTCGQNGYVTPAVPGRPTAAELVGESEVAHKWAKWLCHPCRLGDPYRCRAGGGGIRSGPHVGEVAMSPLPSPGCPPLQSWGGNQKWPTSGQSGYVTPAVSGIPTASKRGSGGQNQRWPTCGQNGYVTPAVSGIPTAAELGGGGSEVAHLWAKWLCHPCRLGDPHRCRAGGGIRSGPLVGKVATSPLPSRGSHRCRAGGEIRRGRLVGKVAMSPLPSRGSPPLQSGGGGGIRSGRQVGKVATSPLPPRGSRALQSGGAGGRIRSGPQVGKMATSPLPSRGSPPLQSGGGGGGGSEVAHLSAKWLRRPFHLGDPHRCRVGGGRSEVAHLWAKWLCHPCRLGDPYRCRAGGGGNRKSPTCGQNGYVTPAVSGMPTAAELGGESEVAHKWAKWLRHPCRLGDPQRFKAGGKIRSGPQVGKMATSPLPSRGSPPLQSGGGGGIRSGPLVGKMATSPLPSRGSPPLQSWGGGQSEVAHLWAKWLCHPCRLGDPYRCRAGGGGIGSRPRVGKMAMSPLPSRGGPPLQSWWGNQKWPTSGQSGYVTPAVSGIPTAAERGGGDQKWPTRGRSGYVTPAVSGMPTAAELGGESEVAHKWAKWLRHPCRLGDPQRFKAGGKIRSGPQVDKVATSPLPSRGSPPLQSGGGELEVADKWAEWLRHPCRLGDPHAAERGGKSEVAHKWAKWLCHPCRLGDPHRCRAGGGGGDQKWPTCRQNGYVTPSVSGIPTAAQLGGGRIRGGPLVGKVAMSPLPSRGSLPLQSGGGGIGSRPRVGKMAMSPLPSRGGPPLQSWGGNQKWPTSGQSGYVTPAVSGIPALQSGGGESEGADLWAKRLRHPCRLGDPHRCRAGGGGGSEVADKWAKWLRHPCRLGDPHRFKAGERGAESEVAHKWAKWLRYPCRLGDPHRCRVGGGAIRSGPHVAKVAMSPLPSRGSLPLQSGGGGGGSEVAHLWAKWLCHPCRLGDAHRCRAGGGIRSGPQVGKVATSPLPSRGSPTLQSGVQNQKWPTSRQSGYVTPTVSGIPTASKRGGGKLEVADKWAKWLRHPCCLGDPHAAERGGKLEVAHLWTKWLRHPCRLRDPHRCGAGGEIRSGPLLGKMATSPPAVSGIRTAEERGGGGGKSEVAHLSAKWLRHPSLLGDPHRCRAGGEIRSGPQVGNVATSPLSSRGSPPLQSGGGGGIRSGRQVGKVATSPLPSLGSPPLQSGAMRQRILGLHTPPCHRRMVITTLFIVLLAALQRRPVLYHTRWLLTVHWLWPSGH